jgi:hypothetical protein
MFSLRCTRRVATVAVVAGLLAVAGPASASSAKPHAATAGVFSGDAYVNEMGITSAGHDAGQILMADMGGQLTRTAPPADGIIAVLIGL